MTLPPVIECPRCGATTTVTVSAEDVGTCANCGLHVASGDVFTEAMLPALAAAIQEKAKELDGPRDFFQMLGPMAPRQGLPDSDAVLFTEETCAMVHDYLAGKGVCYATFSFTGNGETLTSLVIAASEQAMDLVERQARKMARQERRVMKVRRCQETRH